jgi:flavodoxin
MKINITDEIRQEILDMLNRDTAKEYFEKLRDTEKNPTRFTHTGAGSRARKTEPICLRSERFHGAVRLRTA